MQMATTNLIGSELHEHERQLLLRTGYSIVLKHKEFGPASAQEFFGTIKTKFKRTELINIYVGGEDGELAIAMNNGALLSREQGPKSFG
jgi:hypothetical protein